MLPHASFIDFSSFWLNSTFKTNCLIANLFTKNSLNKQGWNSFCKQSKWKATWRNFYDLIQPSTFKASCFIAILFTKTVWIDKPKILSTNSTNERPHEGTLSALIQPPKLAVILKFYSQKNQFELPRAKFFPQTEQMKGLMKELFMPWFTLQN